MGSQYVRDLLGPTGMSPGSRRRSALTPNRLRISYLSRPSFLGIRAGRKWRKPPSLRLEPSKNAVSNRNFAAVGFCDASGQGGNPVAVPVTKLSFQSLGRTRPRPQESFPETNLLSGAGSNRRLGLRP